MTKPSAKRDQTPRPVIDRAAEMLRAAADPGRLEILDLLFSGEHQVSEIAELTGAEMSTTSQRLRVLLKENLVKRRRDGREMYYRLADEHVETLVRNVFEHANPAFSIDTED